MISKVHNMGHLIDFILFPDALGLDVTGPLEVFNTASAISEHVPGKETKYAFRFVAAESGAVRLSSGLEIIADATFEEERPADTLVVPGGIGVAHALRDSIFIAYIRKQARRVKRILSVCNGTFILAEAGLLDGKAATTHWMVAAEFANRYPQVHLTSDAIFTVDGNIYTSAGVTAGIDLALAVVEEDCGLSTALEVSRLLVLYLRRPGSQSQFSAPLKAQQAAGEQFSKLYRWLENNLDQPVSVEKMADYSAMSPRHFARVFKTTTGMTPATFLETLRLDRARALMTAGNQSLDSIAQASGFGREERLRRAFIRRFDVTPSQYRLHFIA
jgi:transcriptional regulator GlxA family with amidase domain